MTHCQFTCRDEADTDRLGAVLAECLPPGTTVGLIGTLGAGKTRLVQAIAAACGVPRENVASPTFVLCHEYHGEYHGRRDIYHFDAYRLKDEDEFEALGVDEYFESPGLTLVEWSDRVRRCLPADRIEIRIEITSETSRGVEISAVGDGLNETLRRLASALLDRGFAVSGFVDRPSSPR